MTRLLIALASAALATSACDGKRQPATGSALSLAPTTAVTAAPPDVAADDFDATLRRVLDQHRALSTHDVYSKERPTYNEPYEYCLIVMAASGATRNSTRADPFCDSYARSVSQASRPEWNQDLRNYFGCLFLFTVRGAPRGVDIVRVCRGPASRY